MNEQIRPQLDHSLIWRPIFDVPIALESVSPFARRLDERVLYRYPMPALRWVLNE